MNRTYSNLLVHLVFSTKNYRPLIDNEIRNELCAYFHGILKDRGCRILAANGPEDHVHLLVSLAPKVSVAEAARLLKTNSSKWVHEKWPAKRSFAWQAGYGVFSVSSSNAPDVRKYIANQRHHHKKVSFQEEFRLFLKKHGVDFDDAHIWDA